ncbi:hypothetical protein HanRHA438_Chr14g0652941 [Helianthus annuus]|nr:hypothetical protein HanIR_Chr14g0696801 [Helianthus annuus]KAJ0659825.1 hypothetical protein HanOQP8_Chr14g0530601 [Helianthus annuus]KAJ0853590.1 hypothetical protein HanRHA438_Chr14g0652941 [Helianthus annuus]
MPFTTLALDRLIEPKDSKPMAPGKSVSDSRMDIQINGSEKPPNIRNSTKNIDKRHHWNQISPALYTTPEPTPLPDVPSSFASSPYVVNHKRRGPRLSKAFSEDDAAIRQALADKTTNDRVRSLEAEDIESCRVVDGIDNANESVEDTDSNIVVNGDLGDETISNNDVVAGQDNLDDFFDPQDSLSVSSSTDQGSSYGAVRSSNLNSSVSEFYDAWEELSSESGSQILSNDVEAELRDIRLSLLTEVDKRKQAEDCINDMKSQWRRVCQQLSLVGLNLPEDLVMLKDQSEDDLEKELSRQINVIRFVSNSIGRGVAKAEIEAEMEVQLESKNFEIARLLDRLRYYEAVNHEMSQRNQETIETVRRARQGRKRRQRWFWSSIVAAVTIGSAALAWSYLPSREGSSLTDPDPPPLDTCEGSSQ